MSEKEVNLQYDEVLSERPGGASSLDALVLISPRDGAPRVGWHRSRISIRGHKDWKPNTTYTVTCFPGSPICAATWTSSAPASCSPPAPRSQGASVSGVIFDWPAGHPAPNALVEAISHPDSTVYIDRADSLGHFTLGAHAAGLVHGVGWVDANNNHDRDEHELQDSTTLTLKDTARVELLAFIHDSIGPHVVTVEVRDSLTLHATFDKPVDPKQPFDSAHIMLRAADSSLVPDQGDRLRARRSTSSAPTPSRAPTRFARAPTRRSAANTSRSTGCPPTPMRAQRVAPRGEPRERSRRASRFR